MLEKLKKVAGWLLDRGEPVRDGASVRFAFVGKSSREGRESRMSSRFTFVYDDGGALAYCGEQHKAATPSFASRARTGANAVASSIRCPAAINSCAPFSTE